MDTLQRTLSKIKPLEQDAMDKAAQYSLQLTKPPGSLGKLEDIAEQLAGIGGSLPLQVRKKAIVVMAGDHGVCDEGVSAYPQEVTVQMMLNIARGGAAVNVLANHVGADVVCVDVGVKGEVQHERVLQRKIAAGTNNMAKGPAMTRQLALQAIATGIGIVEELAAEGYGLFATGEMGIGNTTPSAAMLMAFSDVDLEQAVGRGTGVDDHGLAHKREVVKRALQVNAPDRTDPLDVLSKLGGLEIAGLTGVIIGSAACRCPVVIDGFIASVAALVAYRLEPLTRQFMIASHLSEEPGHELVLKLLDLSPPLHMSMRLGEGTGAVLCMSLVDAAVKVMQQMATFEQAGVAQR